jgi:hypothetical protein
MVRRFHVVCGAALMVAGAAALTVCFPFQASDAGVGGGSNAGPSSSSSSTTTSGGAQECTSGPVGECTNRRCDSDGGMTLVHLDAGTSCSMDGGKVCDGDGGCVACTQNTDCSPNWGYCYDFACFSCADGVQNGDETGIDCGGHCLACDGQACTTDDQCWSHLCACDPAYCVIHTCTSCSSMWPCDAGSECVALHDAGQCQ